MAMSRGIQVATLIFDEAYKLLTEGHGFKKKVSMASISRGTLSLFRWAASNPEKVESIYVDNGVCNVLSWPAGKVVPGNKSLADGAPKSWELFKKKFDYATDEEALASRESPIDQLEPLAKAGVPILTVCGSKDSTVPYEENDAILEQRYKQLGGSIEVIVEDKGHSHGMKDPTPVLEFIKKHTAATQEASHSQDIASSQPYDGSWESLQKMPVPAWFDDGKIGIFIHWGPYSAMGFRKGGRGYSEHVPKMMYRDPDYYFPIVKERWGAQPPEFGYKNIIPDFRAEKWDPEEWAKLFEEVGAKYVVMTAEHHDGWANWDSDLTPWNAVDMGPKRDLVGDLGKALRKHGLKFAPSYHRERHQSFFAEKLYVVDAKPLPMIVEEIKRVPESASLYGPFGTTKEFVDDYVARWKEIQAKYQPDMLWMDDFPIYTRDGNNVRKGKSKPEIQYLDDQVRGMITDFMNDGAARGADVYVNNKGGNRNWPDGVGCLEKDNLKLKQIGPKWQSCTTFGTSFGYLEGDKYKTVEGVIHEMVEVISRNGNFLINIGPKADGTLVPQQVERLRAMGDWLRINGDAIYGSRYWKTYQQAADHLAFTTNGKKLYAISLKKPKAAFTIEATTGWTKDQVKSVSLLGSSSEVSWEMTPAGLQITPPSDLGDSQYAWSFEIATTQEQHSPNAIQADAAAALKGTGKVDLDGSSNLKEKNKRGRPAK